MSNEREHSAVRNLRSIFENKSNENILETRGRSPNGIGSDKENTRPRSRIRASFVAVGPSGSAMAETAGMSELKHVTSADVKQGSLIETDPVEKGAEEEKSTLVTEQAKYEPESSVKETMPESVVESVLPSPLPKTRKVDDTKSLGAAQSDDTPKEDSDKSTAQAEVGPDVVKAADSNSLSSVSGPDALLSVAEDLEAPTSKPAKVNGTATDTKPSSITTKTPSQPPQSSHKSPLSQPKISNVKSSSSAKPESPKPTTKLPSRKPSRSSLATTTTASIGRTATTADTTVPTSLGVYSPPSKPKPKDVTKPLDISARLTAPTAASRARHEQAPDVVISSSDKASIATHVKPTSSTRSAARSSLAGGQRSASRVSLGASSRKPPPPPDGSFLERMTRPTASSQNRAQDKVEVKSTQRSISKPIASLKSKTNGHVKTPRSSIGGPTEVNLNPATLDEASLLKSVGVETKGLAEETKEAIAPIFDPSDHANGTSEVSEMLNGTPSASKPAKAESNELEGNTGLQE